MIKVLPIPRIQLARLRLRVEHQFSRFCTFVWSVLKSRDPWLDLIIRPRDDHHQETDRVRVDLGRKFAAIIPGNSSVEYVITNGLLNFLSLYNFALVGRLILTWFPSRPAALERPLSTICDPYLNLFRGILPTAGGVDFSPIIAFVVLNVFTNATAALPAEIKQKKKKKKEEE
eukprot:g3730.t1